MMEDSKAGIYYDILQKISQRTSLVFEIEFTPTSRSNALFEQGNIDIEPGINPIWRNHSKIPGSYTIAFAKSEDVLLFKQRNFFTRTSLNHLKGKRVGGIRGFIYPKFKSSFASGYIDRFDLNDGPSLLKFFIADRIEYILINKVVAAYWILNNPEYRYADLSSFLALKNSKETEPTDFLIGDVFSSVDIMLRVHPNKKHVLPLLNKAIAELIAEGEIDKIFAKYR
jgi:polar amino acid transport system substrate-binding protein